jgi:hypothetical protein
MDSKQEELHVERTKLEG